MGISSATSSLPPPSHCPSILLQILALTVQTASQFELSSPPEDAISALTFSPRNPTRLLVSSWDKYVHLYDTNAGLNGSKLTAFPHAAPVLDCCFGETDGVLFSGGLDWLVKLCVFLPGILLLAAVDLR